MERAFGLSVHFLRLNKQFWGPLRGGVMTEFPIHGGCPYRTLDIEHPCADIQFVCFFRCNEGVITRFWRWDKKTTWEAATAAGGKGDR